jgi:hypothetical protein
MTLTDEELFDFDEKRLADYDAKKARQDLKQYGDAFRFQLVAAKHIEGWADRLEEHSGTVDPQFNAGYVLALREVAAHLRQSDYLPGGILFDETLEAKL